VLSEQFFSIKAEELLDKTTTIIFSRRTLFHGDSSLIILLRGVANTRIVTDTVRNVQYCNSTLS